MKKFYIDLPPNKIEIVEFFFWTMVAYALFTWFSIQIHTSITADTLWLCDAASRLLAGQTMAAAYYDPNPPLSVMLYVPPVLASMTGLITIHDAVFVYTLLILALSALLTYNILKVIPGIELTTAVSATVALVMANTILSSLSFTERDQILGMMLLPFVLTQTGITKKWPLPPVIKHTTLILGAALILLKPHHGLIPTLIILHRAMAEKRLSVWRDPDFMYLASAVVGYAAILFFYFSDYLNIILPDVTDLYLMNFSEFALIKGVFCALLCITGLLIAFIINNKLWLTYYFFAAAMISIIPFIVQMRGYEYHLMPATTFFWCAVAVMSKDSLQKFMAPQLSLFLTTLLMTVTAFSLTTVRIYFPTHEQYKELPLAKFLEDCESPCPVFVLNNHIEITHQTALYSDKPWASRFPSFWFIPGIFDTDKTTPAELARYREKYGRMVAEDLALYKPQRVLIGTFKLKDGSMFDFIDFFGAEEPFRKEWARYRRNGEFTMDQRVYFPRTSLDKPHPMTYLVFERRPD